MHKAGEPAALPGSRHDHRKCVARAMRSAEEICARRAQRLTAQRRRVLELVWSSHKPVGAYELLNRLAVGGRRPAPPTVYRALDFLLENDLVHRVESLNAYVGCNHPGERHNAQFFICDQCGTAAEREPLTTMHALHEAASEIGFQIASGTIEIHGLCAACRRSQGS